MDKEGRNMDIIRRRKEVEDTWTGWPETTMPIAVQARDRRGRRGVELSPDHRIAERGVNISSSIIQ